MIRPDGGNFTPSEHAFSGRFVSIPERFPRLKLGAATLVGVGAGAAFGMLTGSVIPHLEIAHVAGAGGLFGGLVGAGAWIQR